MSPPASSQPTPTLPLVDLEAIHQRNAAIITRVQALQDAGFRCVPVRSDAQKQLVYPESGTRSYLPTAFCGHTIAIRTGRLADGSYLVRLDLDQHTETQDAEAALDRLMPLIESLPEKFAYKRSTGGQGYDVIFRSPRELPNNQRFALDGCWAGEVFCERGRVVDAGWIAGSPETLVVLTEPELDYLLTLVTIYGTNTAQEVSWQTRKREGLPLIAVYETVNIARFLGPTGMPKSFAGSKLPHQIAQSNWRRLGTARKGQRSEVYAMYVQSLMLLATSSYGMTTEEKCRTVAAIAITHCPRSDQSREQIANDTAVLIARILHGDPYAHRTGNFLVPAWAAAYQAPVRSRGRPAKDRQAQLRTLRRFLSQHVEGQRVERIEHEDLTVALLSRRLGVSERMVQRYLAALEANDEITRSSVPGRRGRLVIDLRPGFAREATLTNTRQTASQTADTVGGWATEVAGDTRAALLDEDSADTRPVTSGEALEGTGAPVDAPDACAAAQASPCAVLPDADGRDQGVAGEAQGHTDSSEARRRRGAQVKQIMDGLMTSLAEMLEREDEETVALRATLLAQFTSVGV